MEVLWWKVLCGHLVEILLCEGGDVEQWLEPQNICCCLRLIYYLLILSLLYLALLYIAHIHMLDVVVCVHTCVEPRELHIAPQLLFRGI